MDFVTLGQSQSHYFFKIIASMCDLGIYYYTKFESVLCVLAVQCSARKPHLYRCSCMNSAYLSIEEAEYCCYQ